MPAKTAPLPNVRKMFTPDPGYIILDADLDRADLQVVVWESGDVELKRFMRLGVDMHIVNGCDLLGVPIPPLDELIEGKHPNYKEHAARYGKQRYFAKRWIHGTNYGGQARTMAIAAGTTVAESERLQRRWFSMHPGILAWHERTREMVMRGVLTNVFGQRRVFFSRDEAAFREGLAWTPQSVVGRVVNAGLKRLDAAGVELLLQVHDSLVMQIFAAHAAAAEMVARVKAAMEVIVPYADPLIIPVSVKLSERSWGHCKTLDA